MCIFVGFLWLGPWKKIEMFLRQNFAQSIDDDLAKAE